MNLKARVQILVFLGIRTRLMFFFYCTHPVSSSVTSHTCRVWKIPARFPWTHLLSSRGGACKKICSYIPPNGKRNISADEIAILAEDQNLINACSSAKRWWWWWYHELVTQRWWWIFNPRAMFFLPLGPHCHYCLFFIHKSRLLNT